MSATIRNRPGKTDLLGLKAQNNLELIRHVEAGLPFSTFENFQRVIGLPASQLAASIVLPPSSLARQKKAANSILPSPSDWCV